MIPKNMATVLPAILTSLALVATGCGGGGGETSRTVTLLSEDAPAQIVVSTTVASTTTAAPTTTMAPTTDVPSTSAEGATASETSVNTVTEPEPAPEETTTTTTTTTVAVVKETIPLAEEEVPAGLKMMDALEEFNNCLADEGVEFIGPPNTDLGPDDPVNQPEYIQALTLCAAQSGIVDAMQEFQSSRVGRTPEQIREDNEQFIELADCLRGKGWTVSDPIPDADGSLGPGEDFTGPDGDLAIGDIRDCISERNLSDGGDEQ
tara:strand:- start:1082 stop:1870 length:789 start_codon:yes stop_codon:yes gene_type:complete